MTDYLDEPFMSHEDYVAANARAAAVLGGEHISTGGGYEAVRVALDGAYLVLAIDIDGPAPEPWVAWREDADGERCCDWNGEEIGATIETPDAELRGAALAAMLAHRCHVWPVAPAPGHCDSSFCRQGGAR